MDTKDKLGFPILKKSKHTGLVVEFTDVTTAHVLIADERYEIGYKTDKWAKVDNEVVWEDVTLDTQPTSSEITDMMNEAITKAASLKDATISGSNDGGKNSFYDFPDWVTNIDTLSEYLQLDGYDFNVLKTLTVNLGARHGGTSKKRELNKRLHYTKLAIKKFQR